MKNMKCADCTQPVRGEVQGIQKCAEHYIEALEHSAHITSLVIGVDSKIKFVPPTAESFKKHLDNPPNL